MAGSPLYKHREDRRNRDYRNTHDVGLFVSRAGPGEVHDRGDVDGKGEGHQ